MSISEAFDEVVAECDPSAVRNIMSVLGIMLPEDDGKPDYTLVMNEIKALVGVLMCQDKEIDVSYEARKELMTGLGRIKMGKPADGVADRIMDADIDSNLDLI